MSGSSRRGTNRRNPKKPSGPTSVPEGGFRLDEPTSTELVKFNAYLAAQRAIEADERRIAKAEGAKDRAAARVRELEADSNASKDDRVAAEDSYKEALAKLEELRSPQPSPSTSPDSAGSASSESDQAESDQAESAAAESAAVDPDADAEPQDADGSRVEAGPEEEAKSPVDSS